MPGSTSKKVIVVRFQREPVIGYVSPGSYLQSGGIEVLTNSGTVFIVPYNEIKSVCFVKTWDQAAISSERKEFTSRPKSEGLWVRFEFKDNDTLEALLPNRLLDIDPAGFLGTPPDASGNTQRIFVPRSALSDCQVLGVIGAAKRPRKKARTEGQMTMFD